MHPLTAPVVAFLAAAGVLVLAGGRFTRVVDRLADVTGIGEALAGAVLLGATTSLPGLIVTVVAAAGGEAELAVSNAFGGIAAQTAFLALADLTYRRANLEHAAASVPNLLQTMILIGAIALVLLAVAAPHIAGLHVHPVSLVLPVGYVLGLALTRRVQRSPLWHPARTAETRVDRPDPAAAAGKAGSTVRLWASFAGLALVVSACGYAIARSGILIAERTALSGTLVGGLFTGVASSLPELVTVLFAVRAGALTLAVGDIIGGNTFDVLFVSAADAAWSEGTIYAAIGARTQFLLALTLLLTAILAAGLIYRDKRGIGFEGVAILAVYAAGFVALARI